MLTFEDRAQFDQAIPFVAKFANELRSHYRRTYGVCQCNGSEGLEDEHLNSLLPEEGGVYVDCGAWLPDECSNTWKLYQRGWRGLLIEPLPECWCPLLIGRPGDYLMPVCVGDHDGTIPFHARRSLSSMSPVRDISDQCDMLCEVRKLSTILEDFPEIRDNCRFLDVDVEGHEREVFAGIDWETFRPEVICAEWKVYAPDAPQPIDQSGSWRPLLEEQGYEVVHVTGTNMIFKLKGD